MIKLNNSNNILTKIEKNERKKECKRKLMLILAPISRFITKKLPFASPSLLLLQSSSMEVWEKVWSYPMNHVCVLSQIHSPFKGKNKQQLKHNCVENEGSQKNRNTPGRGKATTAVAATMVRVGHHGWAVVPTGRAAPLRSSNGAFCLPPWTVGCLSWAICIGLFGLVFFLSCLGLTSNHIFLIKLGPKLSNLQENSTRPKPSVIGEFVDKMQINAK